MKWRIGLLCWLLTSTAQAQDWRWSYLLEGRSYNYDDKSWASAADTLVPQPESVHTADLELNLDAESIVFTAAAVDEAEDDELVVRELYYRADLAGGEALVGRRISSFGVGNAFRPLDLIQRSDLLTHDLQTPTGVNQLAWERFADLSVFGVYLAHPENDNQEHEAEQPALLARYAEAGDVGDWQVLARISDANRWQVATGGVWLPSDAVALYGSLRYSRRDFRQQHSFSGRVTTPLASNDPWSSVAIENTIASVLGLNWTQSQRSNIVVEYWHDPAAMSNSQWQDLFDLMASQHALIDSAVPQDVVQSNLAWSALAWQKPQRLRDNLMLRYQWQGDVLSFVSSLLYTPADGGNMLQAQIIREFQQFGGFKLRFGLRTFDGPTRSLYGQMTRRDELLFSIYGDF